VFGMLWVSVDPVISRPGLPDGVIRPHGCRWMYKPCRTKSIISQPCLAACIDKAPVGGPKTYDDAHLPATRWAAGDDRLRGYDRRGLASDRVCLQEQQAESVGMHGTACMQKAEVTDFHEAVRQDMLQEPADTLSGIEVGGSWACTARFTIGESNDAVLERDDAAIGDSDPEDIGGEVFEGGVSVVMGLTVDVPGDVPDLWVDVPQQSGCAHFLFPHGAVDG
jgi:hypothetical protein